MIECLLRNGGSSKHRYRPYKTSFLRRTRYQCLQCFKKISEQEYYIWLGMWEERERLFRKLKQDS